LQSTSLFTSLKNLKGNARGCVYTEPLWGIPFNLYAPYVSIYMVALGLSDKQIGLLVSIGSACSLIFALLSGVITDKLGRRRASLLADLISWSLPAIISAIAQNYWYFLAAAVINSVWRVSHNAWTCLMVEDTDPDQLVDIYSWVYIAGLLVAFVAPLAGLLIKAYTLVPVMRGLYLFAGIMFAIKAAATYHFTRETKQGLIRMHETKHQNGLLVLRGYTDVFRQVLHTPPTLYTAGIMLILGIVLTINGTFWAILVTEKLHIPNQNLAVFPFVKSVVMLLFFFVVIPRLRFLRFQLPLLAGFAILLISQALLITIPAGNYLWLGLSIILEACAYATVNPLMDRLTVLTVEPQERARIQSILYFAIIVLTSPFGALAGYLSTQNKSYPFMLNILLLLAGMLLVAQAGRAASQREAAAALQPQESV
jgi:MFS family permease